MGVRDFRRPKGIVLNGLYRWLFVMLVFKDRWILEDRSPRTVGYPWIDPFESADEREKDG
jgi:hypothetical protein